MSVAQQNGSQRLHPVTYESAINRD